MTLEKDFGSAVPRIVPREAVADCVREFEGRAEEAPLLMPYYRVEEMTEVFGPVQRVDEAEWWTPFGEADVTTQELERAFGEEGQSGWALRRWGHGYGMVPHCGFSTDRSCFPVPVGLFDFRCVCIPHAEEMPMAPEPEPLTPCRYRWDEGSGRLTCTPGTCSGLCEAVLYCVRPGDPFHRPEDCPKPEDRKPWDVEFDWRYRCVCRASIGALLERILRSRG